MSYQCPKCGNLSEQQVNFCRKCGAPITAESLPTMPLAKETTTMPTPVTEVLSTADPATSILPKPSQTAAIPPTQTKGLSDAPPPTVANPPAAPQPTVTSPPKKSNKNALIAAVAVTLIAMAGISFYFMNRASVPAVDDPIANQATPTPSESATPVEIAAAGSPTPVATESVTAKSPTPTPGGNAKATPTVKAEANVTPNAVVTNATPVYPTPNNAAVNPPPQATPTENAGSLIEQGNRLAGSGQFQEAIQAYEKARRANPGNADVYYLIGSAYHRSGDLPNALEAYRKCTSGTYAAVAANNAKNLEKKLTKVR